MACNLDPYPTLRRGLQPPQHASLMDVGPPSGARWRFTNVRVEQADVALEASVCFSGALLQVGAGAVGRTAHTSPVRAQGCSQRPSSVQDAVCADEEISLGPKLYVPDCY